MERKLEEEKLKDTLDKFDEVIDDLEVTIDSISRNFKLDADNQYMLSKMYKDKLRIVKSAMDRPYFARIDFTDKDGKEEVCYLSKVGISDFDNNLITVDWRVPIASLYYDSNIGDTSYFVGSEEFTGKLTKKRQYEIENKKLISFNDVDTVSNDEILKPYLGVNADNRLKNIVSSIQSEQNQVIRRDLSDNLIVQGVAGSGKTTVALHRIAYLAYNNRDIINSNQYMVIGPNKFFIKYISKVLPDLDVNDVYQLTFHELVEFYLNEKIKVKNIGKIKYPININKYKGSIEYKKLIDNFVNNIDVIGNEDLILNDYLILRNSEIRDIYNSIDKDIYISIESRIDKCIILLSKLIKDNKENILKKIFNKYTSNINNNKKLYDEVYKEINDRDGINIIRKSFKFKNKKVITLYNEFLNEFCDYMSLKHGTYNINYLIEEDLPGILYLGYLVKDRKEFNKYRHVVVDEAQDYSILHFYTINKIFNKSSFSIFGDLAQSIYDYKSISNWESIKDCFEYVDINYLKKSYRTTIEIMNSANKILKYIGLGLADAVIRHGEDVNIIKSNDKYYDIYKLLTSLVDKKYSSIAVITSNDDESKRICVYLSKKDVNYSLITKDNLDYESGICVVDRELSKGLEFDSVIISDCSEEYYDSNNSTDMKRLYVSMTRALHELIILYSDDLCKALKED